MSERKVVHVLALLLLAAIGNNGNDGGGGGGTFILLVQGQTICNIPVAGLRACKPAVTPPRPSQPTADCCAALSHGDFRCLCSYKTSPLLPSLGIDPNLAVQLPRKCGLPAPPC